MYTSVQKDLQKTLDDIQTAGLYKRERLLDSPQASHVLSTEKDLINFCSNNYIGLANNPAVIAAAKESLDVDGIKYDGEITIGGMIEVPAAALSIDSFLKICGLNCIVFIPL